MRLFLDSSAIIDFLKKKEAVVNAVLQADELYTSALCAYEVLLGERYREEKGLGSKYEETLMFFETIVTVPFSHQDAIAASSIVAKLMLKGRKVEQIDALIAAQAIAKEATVLATDQRHFNVLKDEIGLKLYDMHSRDAK